MRRPVLPRLVAALLVMTCCAATVVATPVQKDAGDDLVYYRVRELPADLPNDPQKRPCILDLRYVNADPAASNVLAGWLKFRASRKAPIFTLVNSGTAANVQAVLAKRDAYAGLITIGIAGQRIEPDIVVTGTAEQERKAYDAFDQGATITALTTDHPDKQRNDEASLAHDRGPTSGDDAGATSERAVKRAPAPTDAALQRALHLYRAMRATKKL